MRVAAIQSGRLLIEERPDPVPGEGQILIRVQASGINGADLHQRAGRYPAPPDAPQDVPGLECAGEVAAVGPNAFRFAVGDRVMALLGGGGHAELAVAHERVAVPVPDALDWPAAGGFVEIYATAHDALFTQAGLALGERLLVNGAAGGVGVAAVQLGVSLGARVTASARHGHERLRALGADTEVEGPYDVILELVGGEFLPRDVELLGTGGRLMVIGMGGGSRAEIDFGVLMRKRGRIQSSTLRARPLEEKAMVMQRLERHVLPLAAAGRVGVPVERTFPLEDAEAAFDAFAAGGKFGKLILVPEPPGTIDQGIRRG
jgi:NADPH:quinone reductase-like Zn-dependent oxidoreductase